MNRIHITYLQYKQNIFLKIYDEVRLPNVIVTITSRLRKWCGKQQEVEVHNTDKGTKPGKGG